MPDLATKLRDLANHDNVLEEAIRRMNQPKILGFDSEGFPIDNPEHLPNGDTQIGVEFAIEHLREKQPADNGWRRIETAPKNWTDVLLYDPGYRSDHISGNVFQGYFEAEMEIWCDASAEPVSPTHWQPLPTAPEGGEQP